MQILKNKKLTIIIFACLTVLLVLLCWLLTLVVQENSFKKQVEALQLKSEQLNVDIQKYRDDAEYRQTVDYVIKWAEESGMITPDKAAWIQQEIDRETEELNP